MWLGWETVDIFSIRVLDGVVIVRIVFSSLQVDVPPETSRLAPPGLPWGWRIVPAAGQSKK